MRSNVFQDTIACKFNGIAGQSFGAFLPKALHLN